MSLIVLWSPSGANKLFMCGSAHRMYFGWPAPTSTSCRVINNLHFSANSARGKLSLMDSDNWHAEEGGERNLAACQLSESIQVSKPVQVKISTVRHEDRDKQGK
ncbi:hypothetical protein Q1695_011355 [Nippostrongylus brasiliensis]|nr:hypothetical protein Q1695_011355 [Nippostrongylus brasiliensis]